MQETFTPKHHSDTTKLRKALINGPGKQALNNIFAYAKALDVVHTKMTGQVNLLMN
jgi:hypothetical protein